MQCFKSDYAFLLQSFSSIFCVILIDYYLSPKLLHVQTLIMGMDDKATNLVKNVLQVKRGIRLRSVMMESGDCSRTLALSK